jgi:hypothetical protein
MWRRQLELWLGPAERENHRQITHRLDFGFAEAVHDGYSGRGNCNSSVTPNRCWIRGVYHVSSKLKAFVGWHAWLISQVYWSGPIWGWHFAGKQPVSLANISDLRSSFSWHFAELEHLIISLLGTRSLDFLTFVQLISGNFRTLKRSYCTV